MADLIVLPRCSKREDADAVRRGAVQAHKIAGEALLHGLDLRTLETAVPLIVIGAEPEARTMLARRNRVFFLRPSGDGQ